MDFTYYSIRRKEKSQGGEWVGLMIDGCQSAHSDTSLYNHWLINYLRDRPMRLLAYWLGACH